VENKNIPEGIKPLDAKWVFSIKDNGIYKARLVVKGFRQIKGVDYTCTYFPTIEMDSFRLTISIASIYKWDLRQIDIKAACLNTNLDEKIGVIFNS